MKPYNIEKKLIQRLTFNCISKKTQKSSRIAKPSFLNKKLYPLPSLKNVLQSEKIYHAG